MKPEKFNMIIENLPHFAIWRCEDGQEGGNAEMLAGHSRQQ
jgi:hypothetical protein